MVKMPRNALFAEYATRIAFMLSLSRRQVDVLLAAEAQDWEAIFAYGPSVPTCRILQEKGLLLAPRMEKQGTEAPVVVHELTEAGRLTCALLREAGFINRLRLTLRPCNRQFLKETPA